MKKAIVWLTVFLCAFTVLLSACRPDAPDTPSSSEPSSTESAPPEYQTGSIKLIPQDQDDFSFNRSYRLVYYQIQGEFAELLNEEEFADYMEWADQKAKEDGYGEFQNEMFLVSFIKRYNIPREKFDQAVAKYVAYCNDAGWDLSNEQNEAPNGDVIYTFDNEIINRYYRYE